MSIQVSVVIPIRNEEKYIAGLLASLAEQTYPKEKTEWIFVDGMSEDRTLQIIEEFRDRNDFRIKILSNPHRTVPFAMNLGIRESTGAYIVRLDAHSLYHPEYIARSVRYLETMDIDNVGGIAETISHTEMGDAIAKVLSSRFGVGNSQFRVDTKGGYVDTVPFGAFRRELFDRIGYYNEKLTRNQDNEFNYRIRNAGGKIYLAPDIQFKYFGRDRIDSLLKMARQNGYWNIVTRQLMPGSMGLRHFIPLLFVVSLIGLLILSLFHWVFRVLLILEVALYLSLDMFFSAKLAGNLKEFFRLLLLFPLFHIHYGLGSVKGIVKTYLTRTA